jgi:hypothetical protein
MSKTQEIISQIEARPTTPAWSVGHHTARKSSKRGFRYEVVLTHPVTGDVFIVDLVR